MSASFPLLSPKPLAPSHPLSEVKSQVHIYHLPIPSICNHKLCLPACYCKWIIATRIPGATAICMLGQSPTGLFKNVAAQILPPLNEPFFHFYQYTNMLWLSPISFHFFFHQLLSHSFTLYCSTSQKRYLLYCHQFLFPVFLKRNPVRCSHIPLHTTSLAKITSDYRVITSWWAVHQSHLNDLSATFETVNHSLLFDILSSLRLSSSTCSWLSYYCTGCSFSYSFTASFSLLQPLNIKVTLYPVFGILFFSTYSYSTLVILSSSMT